MTRVGFTLIGGGRGTGGYNYLLNLLGVLAAHESGRIAPVLFIGTDVGTTEVAPFDAMAGLEVIRDGAFDRSRDAGALAAALVTGADRARRTIVVEHRVDLLFESAQFFGWRPGAAVVAWIPDFQHRLLPHMFTLAGQLRREIGLRAQMAAGRTIMLSSADARASCERLYPQTVGRTATVRFAVAPGAAPLLAEARRIAQGYGLPQHFFFMPNQFSRHKNHLLVIDALAMLRERGVEVCIAASGKPADERHPEHFAAVQRHLTAAGVEGQLRLLGLIPYPHLAALMRASVALLNPSLFEGWSTPVEEARSMGVPLLLSDLDVHREQAGDAATYFDRHSAASLATALQTFVALADDERDARFAAAREAAEVRVSRFAADFADLAERCTSKCAAA